jgi:PTH1 family peptidyl-tRNA hydrolase
MAIRFFVGLGNPGQDYEFTRHNIGYRVVDELARRLPTDSWSSSGSSLVARARMDDGPIWLVMPTTYMNLSGRAVRDLCDTHDASPEELLVFVDDIDLELGRLRLRPAGGPGTHNGLRSIVQAVGTGFPRLRVGIKAPAQWNDVADFVLSDFTDDEAGIVLQAVCRAAEAAVSAAREGLEAAMNRFNGVA